MKADMNNDDKRLSKRLEKEKAEYTFNEWLKTEAGRKVNDVNTLTKDQVYLTNRLWWCWEAATTGGMPHTVEQQTRIIDVLRKEIRNKHREILQLKNKLKQLSPEPKKESHPCLNCGSPLLKNNQKWCDHICKSKYKYSR